MAHFTQLVDGSWINTDEIERVEKDAVSVTLKSGKTVALKAPVGLSVARVIPADSTCFAVAIDAKNFEYHDEPILAWAVMISGEISPITPFHPDGVWDFPPAIRRTQMRGIFHKSGTYEGMTEFLEYLAGNPGKAAD